MTRLNIPTFLGVAAMTVVLGFGLAPKSRADSFTTQHSFQNVFETAGYATALGAGLGAASLAFVDKPQNKLHHVTIGASIGFIAGSFYGTYLAFQPTLSLNAHETDYLATRSNKGTGIQIRPNFNTTSSGIDAWVAVMQVTSF